VTPFPPIQSIDVASTGPANLHCGGALSRHAEVIQRGLRGAPGGASRPSVAPRRRRACPHPLSIIARCLSLSLVISSHLWTPLRLLDVGRQRRESIAHGAQQPSGELGVRGGGGGGGSGRVRTWIWVWIWGK